MSHLQRAAILFALLCSTPVAFARPVAYTAYGSFKRVGFFARGPLARIAAQRALAAEMQVASAGEGATSERRLVSSSAEIVRVPAEFFQRKAQRRSDGSVTMQFRPNLVDRVTNFLFGKDRRVRAVKTALLFERE